MTNLPPPRDGGRRGRCATGRAGRGAVGDSETMALVDFMTEPDKAQSWERRKEAVVAKLAGATRTETALVIADKGCNLRDMLRAAATSQASVDSTNRQENLVAGGEARGNLGARGDAPAPVTLSSISVELSPSRTGRLS